jgi:hypothetical protein
MNREWQVAGKGLTEEHADDIHGYFENMHVDAVGLSEGELEKTLEETAVLTAINFWLMDEASSLGIPYQPFTPKQFHLFSEDDFPGTANAYRKRPYDLIFINKDAWPGSSLYITFTHEAVELQAFRRYHADVDQMNMREERAGYIISNRSELDHEHFYGFHDASVERAAREIYGQHVSELSSLVQITPDEQENPPFPSEYAVDLEILDTIIAGVAEGNGLSDDEVWMRIKRGLFEGGYMHLRRIENAFGLGSLRVLAAWESATVRMPEEELDHAVLRFFQSNDEGEKQSIAHSVLNERERFRYNHLRRNL